MALQSSTDGTLQDLGPKVAAYQHPIYATYAPIWKQLAHVREGAGGFLDGTYLVAHPREWKDHTAENPQVPTKKLKGRRKLAAYENFASTIIESKKSALFREKPIRRLDGSSASETKDTIQEWWHGTDLWPGLDAQWRSIWDATATFGHLYLYLDRDKETGWPYLCAYTPLDVPDWLTDSRGRLTRIKFVEPEPRATLNDPITIGAYQVRIVTDEGWTVYNSGGKAIESGQHGMGRLPVIKLHALHRPITHEIGQSVLSDPRLYIDLFNLLSELRELLRNQTFSILNIPLGTGDQAITVENAQTMLGATSGTENVLFSGLAAGYISADSSNVDSYQKEIDRRVRTIYRLAGISWEADSRDAESAGSLKLKREEMNTRLAMYADELERAELELTDLWYRATYGADAGLIRKKRDMPFVHWPDTFDVTPFDVVLQQAQSALSLEFPRRFFQELQKSLVSKFLPNAAPATVADIEQAIDETLAETVDPIGEALRRQVAA